MKVLLTAVIPESFPKNVRHVTGLEPWHVVDLATDLGQSIPQDVLASADVLRTKGPSALTNTQRAFWQHFYVETKPILPTPGEAVEVAADVEDAMKLLTEGVDAKTMATLEAELQTAIERADRSLVSRAGSVGLFADRNAIRVTALPEWTKAAIVVNTKTEAVEVIQVGHCPLLQLDVCCSAMAPGPWAGHRYRIRRKGLLHIKDLHYSMGVLQAAVDRSPRDNHVGPV